MSALDRETIGPLIGIAVLVVVMSIRLLRGQKQRPLKLEWMWVMPLVLIALACALISQFPPQGLEWLWLTLAFGAGAALGWQRGRLMAITVDPQTHMLNQQASPAAMIFLVVLVAIRFGLRSVLSEEAGALHLSAAFLTDVFVVFAVGLLAVTRLEMFLRARRLLEDARAAGKIVS